MAFVTRARFLCNHGNKRAVRQDFLPSIGRVQSCLRPCSDQRWKLVEPLDYSIGNDVPKRRTLVVRAPNSAHADLLPAPHIIDRAIPDHHSLIGRDTQAL